MTVIVSVLKQGPEYGVTEAQFLHNQLKQLKGFRSVCLSDIEIPGVETIKLKHDWPGWWSKLELFNECTPMLGSEDLFYIDIDTLITGDLTELIEERTKSRQMTMLTDFYNEKVVSRPPASGVMFIPKEIKSVVWEKWFEYGAEHAMRDFTKPPRSGDQGFIGHVLPDTDRWQNVHPGAILSYKKDIAGKGMLGYHNVRSEGTGVIPSATKIVCFHGKPRPWHVDYQALLATRMTMA